MIQKLLIQVRSYFYKQNTETDPAYYDAEMFIQEKSTITYNQLQKGLNIGYARTARIMEMLESNHKIGPKENGREKREVRN